MTTDTNTELPEDASAEDAAANSDTAGASAVLAAPLAETPRLDATEPLHFEMLDRLAQLETALLARDPMMKVHLGAIHKNLIQHEELVHLLTDQQIGQIVGAQQAHTNTSLLQELTSKAGKAKAANRTAKISLGDL